MRACLWTALPAGFTHCSLFARKSPALLRKEVCWCVPPHIWGRHYFFGARLHINLFHLISVSWRWWRWTRHRDSAREERNSNRIKMCSVSLDPHPLTPQCLPTSCCFRYPVGGHNWHQNFPWPPVDQPTLPLNCKAYLSCDSRHGGSEESPPEKPRVLNRLWGGEEDFLVWGPILKHTISFDNNPHWPFPEASSFSVLILFSVPLPAQKINSRVLHIAWSSASMFTEVYSPQITSAFLSPTVRKDI